MTQAETYLREFVNDKLDIIHNNRHSAYTRRCPCADDREEFESILRLLQSEQRTAIRDATR